MVSPVPQFLFPQTAGVCVGRAHSLDMDVGRGSLGCRPGWGLRVGPGCSVGRGAGLAGFEVLPGSQASC